jgi:hypothetical protein
MNFIKKTDKLKTKALKIIFLCNGYLKILPVEN